MKMLFMGRKVGAARALEWVIEQGIEIVGVLTDSHLKDSPTQAVAQSNSLTILTLEDVYSGIEAKKLKFDFAVSYVYWRILKETLISAAPLGVINFHPAPLPDLKGTGGYNVAILDGRRSYGVTAHYIDSGIDTGAIIERVDFQIDPDFETAQTLEASSQSEMLKLFKRTVSRVVQNGRLPSQPHKGGRYISRPEMEAMKEIKAGDDIDRKIRAFWYPPYTGAYKLINGVRYTLVNDQLLQDLAPEETSLFSAEHEENTQT